jgi:hypothetical protein
VAKEASEAEGFSFANSGSENSGEYRGSSYEAFGEEIKVDADSNPGKEDEKYAGKDYEAPVEEDEKARHKPGSDTPSQDSEEFYGDDYEALVEEDEKNESLRVVGEPSEEKEKFDDDSFRKATTSDMEEENSHDLPAEFDDQKALDYQESNNNELEDDNNDPGNENLDEDQFKTANSEQTETEDKISLELSDTVEESEPVIEEAEELRPSLDDEDNSNSKTSGLDNILNEISSVSKENLSAKNNQDNAVSNSALDQALAKMGADDKLDGIEESIAATTKDKDFNLDNIEFHFAKLDEPASLNPASANLESNPSTASKPEAYPAQAAKENPSEASQKTTQLQPTYFSKPQKSALFISSVAEAESNNVAVDSLSTNSPLASSHHLDFTNNTSEIVLPNSGIDKKKLLKQFLYGLFLLVFIIVLAYFGYKIFKEVKRIT